MKRESQCRRGRRLRSKCREPPNTGPFPNYSALPAPRERQERGRHGCEAEVHPPRSHAVCTQQPPCRTMRPPITAHLTLKLPFAAPGTHDKRQPFHSPACVLADKSIFPDPFQVPCFCVCSPRVSQFCSQSPKWLRVSRVVASSGFTWVQAVGEPLSLPLSCDQGPTVFLSTATRHPSSNVRLWPMGQLPVFHGPRLRLFPPSRRLGEMPSSACVNRKMQNAMPA